MLRTLNNIDTLNLNNIDNNIDRVNACLDIHISELMLDSSLDIIGAQLEFS